MRPVDFVFALKQLVREQAAGEVAYIADPPVPDPPTHLGEFSRWWRGLDHAQRETARQLVQYVAEGSLFDLLNVLDNVLSLPGHPGSFEVFYVLGESRMLLNDAEGDLLYDLFNQIE
jgi:hypothetical protein